MKIYRCEGPSYGRGCGAAVHLQDQDYPTRALCPLCQKEQGLITLADSTGYRNGKALGEKAGRFRAPVWQVIGAVYLMRQYLNSFREGFLE